MHCDDISTTLNLTRSLSLPLSLSGVHIYQVMYGCEWDEETGITDVLFQYGHDREDFISFDLKTMTWVTPKPQAVITKHKYDSNIAVNEGYKHYLTQRCITCLKKYLQNGKSTLQRIGTETLGQCLLHTQFLFNTVEFLNVCIELYISHNTVNTVHC